MQRRNDNRLLAVVCALRAYRVEKGAYPTALSALAANGCLKRGVPADPFSPEGTAPFRYQRLAGDKYRLYGVGPDGVDDGGKPFTSLGQRSPDGTPLRFIYLDTKGDYVVGVDTGL